MSDLEKLEEALKHLVHWPDQRKYAERIRELFKQRDQLIERLETELGVRIADTVLKEIATNANADLQEALRFVLNQAFTAGRNSPTAIYDNPESVTLGTQRIYQLFNERIDELAAVKIERNEAICDVNRLCRERIPVAEVREMLDRIMHIAVALDAEYDVDPDKHWPEQIDAILKRHGYEVSDD